MVLFSGCQKSGRTTTDSGVQTSSTTVREASPVETQVAVSKAYSQFIDVRTPEEYAGGHAARAVNIPLDTLMGSLDRLEKNEPVYLICQTGRRSGQAAEMLKGAGFSNVINVTGGTTAWQAADLPMETKPPHNVPAPK
ncbi:MAG: rhodanese-like domain-containing protein [Chloracidobacterium sp.]|nr:rhodanese-like domain-containing protein [Chloracidobacterium sp.]MBK7801876.1 rhodanese-like domain-containing protein [Chloracidobacterium sp.]MBK9437979.1 rhodanese-like domain-containing protein [Chloracidobacterium sp.]MBK9765586.1 rhodanese-like domain-containing protein [Chloracidobacterium sp.]MBL0242182.1 rhodanese-like domain-containing protein [Chloracidobacterium sp.]